MGADGGTIPKRCELVKAKKKVEKVDKATKNATKWKNCQMSQTPLKVVFFVSVYFVLLSEARYCLQIWAPL